MSTPTFVASQRTQIDQDFCRSKDLRGLAEGAGGVGCAVSWQDAVQTTCEAMSRLKGLQGPGLCEFLRGCFFVFFVCCLFRLEKETVSGPFGSTQTIPRKCKHCSPWHASELKI